MQTATKNNQKPNSVTLENLLDIKEYDEGIENAITPIKNVLIQELLRYLYAKNMWEKVREVVLKRANKQFGWKSKYNAIVNEINSILNAVAVDAFAQGILYPKITVIALYPVVHHDTCATQKPKDFILHHTEVMAFDNETGAIHVALLFRPPPTLQKRAPRVHIKVIFSIRVEALL